MKKIITLIAALLLCGAPMAAKTASQLRVYINPGHGSWTANDRPMSLIGHPNYYLTGTTIDTLRFFESNTNLQKGFGMLEECIKYGLSFDRTKNQSNSYDYKRGAAMDMSNNIVMSRVKNGPSDQYSGTSTSYNKNLSEIQSEAQYNNFDFFISIHSNATGSADSDGEYRSTFNRPIILYRGYTDPTTSATGVTTAFMTTSRNMSLKANTYLLKDVHQAYSSDALWTVGDISFYGSSSVNSNGYRGYLGALKHGVPGYLTEGYFHTYSPARHRAMQWRVDHVEGWYYASAMADYFGIAKTGKGWIYGIVRDKTTIMDYKQYYARTGTNDVYHPINGCTVVLKQNGIELQRMKTDNYYNGAYVFKDLAPGTYTVQHYHANFISGVSYNVTVTADNITYQTDFLTPGTGIAEPEDPTVPDFAETYNLRQRYVDYDIPELQGKKIRRVVPFYYYLYILALDDSNNPTILLYHPDTRKIITNISTTGMDGTELKCSDIQVTSDGVLLACNKELTQCDDSYVYDGDQRRGKFIIYKWANNEWQIPQGNPIPWLASYYTGDWYRSYAGDTFAYSGSTTTGKAVFSCETTGSTRGIRTMVIPVANGVGGTESYHQPYYQGAAANFSVTNFGDGYRFITSPSNPDNYLVMGSGSNPVVECAFKHTNKAEVLSVLNGDAMPYATPNGGVLKFGDHPLLVAPLVSNNNVSGVRCVDLSYGLPYGQASTLTGNTIPSVWFSSYYAAGRQLWRSNSSTGAQGTYLDIFLMRGSKFSYFTTAPDTTDPVPVFVEKWNVSDAKGNTQALGWDATQVRNIEFNQGKLYMVYKQNDIKVVNASTGADLGNLNKAWVYGGTVRLADVKLCDGKIVASNIALSANGDAFRLYRWNNDNSNPEVILDTRDFGGAIRVGDYIGWTGTWTSGAFLFCSDDGTNTRLLRYAVTDGVVSPNPTVTYLTTDGATQLKTSISARVTPDTDGYWIDGRANLLTFVDMNGTKKFAVNQEKTLGNAFKVINYEGSVYGLTTAYATDDLGGGRMRMICGDKGWQNTYYVADYPAAGLSSSRTNGNGTTGIATYVHDNTIEVWLSITNQGLAYFCNREGSPATFNVSPIQQIKPFIMTSRAFGNISVKTGESASLPISLSGAYLCDDIHLEIIEDAAGIFSLSKSKVSINSAAETIRVYASPLSAGSYSAKIRLTSENCDDVILTLTASVTDEGNFEECIGELEEKWEYSEQKDNIDDASGWLNVNERASRDLCVANHRLYVLSSSAWNTNPEVSILGAYGSAYYGKLNMEGMSGGENIAASLGELGGHVIMSNAARYAGVNGSPYTDVLKVYKWSSESSAPKLWLQDAEHGGIQAGDIMSVWGDLTRGKVLFSDGSKVLVYDVNYGYIAQTPKVINLTYGGQPYSVSNFKSNVTVSMADDGSFWLTGNLGYPARFSADGEYIESFTADNIVGGPQGTSSSFFSVGDRLYMATATYLDVTAPEQPMTEGAMAIVDYTDGASQAFTSVVYPEEGLGSTNNPYYASKVLVEQSTDLERLNLWVLIPYQGIAHYKYDASNPSTGIVSIGADRLPAVDGEVYYNLQGLRVDPANLTPGIYIVKSGTTTRKVRI